MVKELQASEQQKFHDLIFCNIKEEDFACLYSETDSRPNVPVNCMVSALILQHRYRLTYEKLFDSIKFNLLTKIALGLQTLDEVPFSEASIFNFQNKLNSYFIETGINLLERVFDHLTENQLKELKIKTDIQRTDSFQAASNIRRYSRLQLLVEMLIRIHRVLTEQDKKQYGELFAPYVKKTSGQFIYRLETEDILSELERVGKVYKEINDKLKPKYESIDGRIDIFKTFERVYTEHFTEVDEEIIIKRAEELTSRCLQSPDDIDATYRKKNNKQFYGQAINIAETCNPVNPIDLLTDVSVHANNIDDCNGLNERIEPIKEKTPELNELHTDGAYGSKDNDVKFDEHGITHIQTAIRGRENSGVEITINQAGEDRYLVSCPNQSVEAEPGRKRFKAEFDLSICSSCAFASVCKLQPNKSARVYYFTSEEYLKKKRLVSIQNIPKDRRSLRTNIEATVSEFTRKMNNRKLKVRGYFKATIFAFAVGISVNFGRIYRYLKAQELEKALATS
jgi:hypothetical protein